MLAGSNHLHVYNLYFGRARERINGSRASWWHRAYTQRIFRHNISYGSRYPTHPSGIGWEESDWSLHVRPYWWRALLIEKTLSKSCTVGLSKPGPIFASEKASFEIRLESLSPFDGLTRLEYRPILQHCHFFGVLSIRIQQSPILQPLSTAFSALE